MKATLHVLNGRYFEEAVEKEACLVPDSKRCNASWFRRSEDMTPKWSSIEEGSPSFRAFSSLVEFDGTQVVGDSKSFKKIASPYKWIVYSLLLFIGTTASITVANFLQNKDKTYLQQTSHHRRLSESNIFQKSNSKYLVQWGIARRGCRPPPQATLRLTCQGGQLEVLHDDSDCQRVSPHGVDCPLERSSVEFNGADWTLGLVVASCDKISTRLSQGDVPTFSATFDMTFPSVCSGIPKNDTEDGALAVGGYENYLVTSQLCVNSNDEVQYLPASSCSKGTELFFESLGDNQTAKLCQTTDYCRVPKCPVDFLCGNEDFNRCKVRPGAIQSVPQTVQTCQALGLHDVGEKEPLWEVLESDKVTIESLWDAGFGSGPSVDTN